MGAILGIAVFVFIIGRQLTARPLGNLTLPLILMVLGAAECGAFLVGGGDQLAETLKGQREFQPVINTGTLVVALLGSSFLSVVFAVARVPTFKLWRDNGQIWRKGSALTAILWITSLAVHFGYDALVSKGASAGAKIGDFGSATTLLYLALSLLTQRILLRVRSLFLR